MKNSFLVLLSLMVAFHFSSAANGINYLDKASTRKTANLSEIFASDPLYAVSGDENPKPRTTGSGPGTTAEIRCKPILCFPDRFGCRNRINGQPLGLEDRVKSTGGCQAG